MAPIHPSTKLPALALLVVASAAARVVSGERPEQAVTSLGLRAAAEALAAAQQSSGHRNDAAAVDALRAALDLARAALELYAAAAGVDPVQEHGLLLTLAKAVDRDDDGKAGTGSTTKGKGTANAQSSDGKAVDGGKDSGKASGGPPGRSLLHVGQQVWHMLQDVR